MYTLSISLSAYIEIPSTCCVMHLSVLQLYDVLLEAFLCWHDWL